MADEPYEVLVSASAQRDLIRVPARIVPAVVEFLYGDFAAAPRRVGKPLSRDLEGLWSARRGPYRILYEVDEDVRRLNVLRIAYRADAYRPR